MKRFIIFDPSNDSYVRMANGGWTSGHKAEEVNSYGSFKAAQEAGSRFDSLKNCTVVEIMKHVAHVRAAGTVFMV